MFSVFNKLLGLGTSYFVVPSEDDSNTNGNNTITPTRIALNPENTTIIPSATTAVKPSIHEQKEFRMTAVKPSTQTQMTALRRSSLAKQPKNLPPQNNNVNTCSSSTPDEKLDLHTPNTIYYAVEIGTLRPRIAVNNTFLPVADKGLYQKELDYHSEDMPNNLFYFAYKILPDISELMDNFFQNRTMLKNIPHSESTLVKVEKLNLAIKNIVLNLDFLEIQFGLESNYFTESNLFDDQSMSDIIKEFHDWVQNLGYEFNAADSHPYYTTRMAQLKRLFEESNEPKFKERLIIRYKEMEQALKIENSQHKKEQKQTQANIAFKKSTKIISLIEQRITALEKEKILWVARGKAKAKIIEDLNTVKNQLKNGNSLEQVLNTVSLHPHLVEGSASPILKQMRLTASTNLDRIRLINLEIAKLEKSRNTLFSRKLRLEKRILALQNLKSMLNQPGYLLEESLSVLSKKYPEDHKILLTYEEKLLANITEIDQAISDKTTEIHLDGDEKSRARYPSHLRGITKIHELDLANSNEVIRNIIGELPKFTNINVQDDSWSIAKINIKHIKPTVNFENTSGAILGKKMINYQQQTEQSSRMGVHNSKIINAINTHIQSVENIIRNRWCFSLDRTPDKKLRLLHELNKQLETLSLRDALAKILYNPKFSKDYLLLQQGETKKIFKTIEDADATHLDLIQKVSLHILQLKKAQTTNPGFFTRRVPALVERIAALQQLQTYLEEASQKNNPEDRFYAIGKLRAHQRAILETHDNVIYSQADNWEMTNYSSRKLVI